MSAPIRLKLTGIVMALALGMLALNVTPAAAKTGYANICPVLQTAFCEASSSQGGGVAVDNSSNPSLKGDVWIVTGGVLQEFDPSGDLLGEINESNVPGSAATHFHDGYSDAYDAVDPADGGVYYASITESRAGATYYHYEGTVAKFSSSGVFQFQITGSEMPQGESFFNPAGVVVDPSTGDLYVVDNDEERSGLYGGTVIAKFSSSGAYLGQLPMPGGADGIAFAPEGNLYVTTFNGVERYSSSGAPVDCPDGSNLLSIVHRQVETGAVAVDPSDGHIFVDAYVDGEYAIAEYSSFCAGEPSAIVGRGEFGGASATGIGVNESTHQIYAGVYQTSSPLIFGLVSVPSLATGAAPASITRTSAVVSGTVNPEGAPVTFCEFEYGQTEVYGQSVPCSSPHEVSGSEPLTGSTAIAVSAELKLPGLPPASKVYYRLKAGNGAGYEVDKDQTFYTEALPAPAIGGLPASSVTQSSATLNGTLGTGEALVNYHFEYGTTTAYGLIAPVPDAFTPITSETLALSQPVSGLQAGTTYHYRLVASSPGGTEVKGPDETFTTLSIPAPAVATGASEGVGVGSATLTGTVDPHGWDTTYLFQYGTSTTYGSSWPSIEVDMGALEGAQPVVVSVPNLLPDTTYHYRLIATSGGGTSYGPDVTFTTTEYPASIIQEAPLVSLPKVTTTTITKTKSETKAQKLAKALKACGKDKNKGKREVCERAAHKDFGTKQKGKAKKK
jgi:hypothetical protein